MEEGGGGYAYRRSCSGEVTVAGGATARERKEEENALIFVP